VGVASENGQPMHLPSLMKHFNDLTPAEAVAYAPVTGEPGLRQCWRDELIRKNPSLANKSFSLPIVTSGLTHALSLVGDLFVDRGVMVLLPDKYWENYELMFAMRLQAQLGLYPFFTVSGGFNVDALRQALATRAGSWKTILILNFPNSPTGYCISRSEADDITRVLCEAANDGRNLVVVLDDAYAGLTYDDTACSESLFAKLAGAHDRILAVKIDGPSKEHFVWGLRLGMLTFSTRAYFSDQALYSALEQKAAGAIRSTVSSSSHPAQSAFLKAANDTAFHAEWQSKKETLSARAAKAHAILRGSSFSDAWDVYPFNSGYFLCLRLKSLHAEEYRRYLLEKYGIGIVAEGERDIRVALSSVDEQDLEELFNLMAAAACELRAADKG
jgi:aspartate/methionine/tyrosine aminotransferase